MARHTLEAFVLVIVKKNDEVVMLKRADNASFAPSHYCIPGGGVEKGETFREAAQREIFEEVGVTVHLNDLKFVHAFYRKNTVAELVVHVFECTAWQGNPYNKEPDKHTEMMWCDVHHTPEQIVPAHKVVLNCIQKNIFYSEHK